MTTPFGDACVDRDVASISGGSRAVSPISIRHCGVLAGDICRHGGRARVAGVFERSFYLQCDEDFLCVGAPAIGNGPLTLIADFGATRAAAFGLRVGQGADISARQISIGTLRLSLDRCEVWRPPAWLVAPRGGVSAEVFAALARRIAIEAPLEGLACAAFGTPSALATLPAQRLVQFEGWLVGACSGEERSPDCVRDLIGLGHGLTPSGDDYLCGALAMLDALGEQRIRAALADIIVPAASALTSPLSACFLRATAARHYGERLYDTVAALIVGDVPAAVASARDIGHSSGWDILAGAATTLRIVAAGKN